MQINKNLNIYWTNVLIIGNRSYRNLGDELILAWTIKLLQQQGKKVFVQAYDHKWLRGFLEGFVDVSDITFLTEIPKGIRSIFWYIFGAKRQELWEYRKIDSVIVGGGEIFTEENPNSYRYRLVSLLPILTKKMIVKTKIYLMGGIQIPQKNLNTKLFKEFLKHVTHIYARDLETVDNLKSFGYKNVEFLMDTAYFAWNWPTHVQWRAKYIVVNVNKNGEHFLDKIVQDIEIYAKKWYHIYYVPVSKGKNLEYNDIKYYDILKKRFKMEILDREYDFASFVDVLKWAEIVISTRLHLFLMAEFIGVKTKVCPYQKKILKMQKVLKEIKL